MRTKTVIRAVGFALFLFGMAAICYAAIAVDDFPSALVLSWFVGTPALFIGATVWAEA